jgi:hypothetical protein
MSFLGTLQADLRERQIYPAVVVLGVLAIGIPVAAPIVLGKVSTPPATASLIPHVQPPAGVTPPQRELTDLATVPPPRWIVRKGSEPDPFREKTISSGGKTAASSRSSGAPASAPKSRPKSTTKTTTTTTKTHTTSSGGTAPKSTGTSKTTTTGSKTTSTGSKTTTKPATGGSSQGSSQPAQGTGTSGPASLKPDQAYTVSIDTKDANGVHTLSDVVRLAPLPAAQSPEVIYLGVVQGGKKAAFLFTNAIAVSSKSAAGLTCLPSNSDCQIVELEPRQGLSLYPTSNSALIATFTFELVSIGATTYSSDFAAMQARDAVSTAGQTLLPLSNSTELSSLTFSAKIGALVHHSGGSSGNSTGSTGSTGTTGTTGVTGNSSNSQAVGIAFAVSPPR